VTKPVKLASTVWGPKRNYFDVAIDALYPVRNPNLGDPTVYDCGILSVIAWPNGTFKVSVSNDHVSGGGPRSSHAAMVLDRDELKDFVASLMELAGLDGELW